MSWANMVAESGNDDNDDDENDDNSSIVHAGPASYVHMCACVCYRG